MRETAYAFCKDSKCLYETYTKEKEDALLDNVNSSINTANSKITTLQTNVNNVYTKSQTDDLLNEKQKKITSGTASPSGGNNGDIYLKYS